MAEHPEIDDGRARTTSRGRTAAWAGLAAALGLAAGIGAVYVTGGFADNTRTACAASPARIAAIDPLIEGPVAALQPLERPVSLSALGFGNADGEGVTIADFAGETVLLNLWATWCAPCRAEMPDLAALQQDLGGKDFEVVAVSVDTRADKAGLEQFLKDTDASGLDLYREPTMTLFNTLKEADLALGMPTSLLIDGDGCALAVLHGPAAWSAPRAKRLIRAAIEN